MKMELFHQIGPGGDDSATVRRFVVEHGLSEQIEFSNVGYEETSKRWSKVSQVVPCLVTTDAVIEGKVNILAYLKTLAH